MARRRMISENLLYDPSFNSLSIQAQNLFVKMLIKTDDYGILPADQWSMLNLSKQIEDNLDKLIAEMETAGLIQGILYDEKPFLVFKRDRFDEYQSYLIQKRTRSEYLRLEKPVMEGDGFQEILKNSWKFQKVTPVTHRKYKVLSTKIKYKEERERVFYQNEKLVISDGLREKFAAEFGRMALDQQIPVMERWLRVNKPKKDYNRFVWNWLNRSTGEGISTKAPRAKKAGHCMIHSVDFDTTFCPKCFVDPQKGERQK